MNRSPLRFALLITALTAGLLSMPVSAQDVGASPAAAPAATPATAPASVASGGQSAFEKARVSENVCLVRKAYAVSAAQPHQGIKDAVEQCVNFEQGLAGWYRDERGRRGEVFLESDPTAKKTLVTLQAMAQAYLETYLGRCEAAQESEKACLSRLKLPTE